MTPYTLQQAAALTISGSASETALYGIGAHLDQVGELMSDGWACFEQDYEETRLDAEVGHDSGSVHR